MQKRAWTGLMAALAPIDMPGWIRQLKGNSIAAPRIDIIDGQEPNRLSRNGKE